MWGQGGSGRCKITNAHMVETSLIPEEIDWVSFVFFAKWRIGPDENMATLLQDCGNIVPPHPDAGK